MKIYEFGATWCGMCKAQTKHVQDFAREKGLVVSEWDADKDAQVFSQFGVRNIPCTILVNEQDEVIARTNGVNPVVKLEEVFGKYLTIEGI